VLSNAEKEVIRGRSVEFLAHGTGVAHGGRMHSVIGISQCRFEFVDTRWCTNGYKRDVLHLLAADVFNEGFFSSGRSVRKRWPLPVLGCRSPSGG